jgi:hypothetical protein
MDDNHTTKVPHRRNEMSGTQESIGIKPEHDVQSLPKSDGHVYNNDLRGQRKSSKSATRPWKADTPVSAKGAKQSKRVSVEYLG